MSEDNDRGRQRRASFRLEYPFDKSPRILISGMVYAVADISERGVRFYNPLRHRIPDDIFSAQLIFQDGETIKVVGRVVRVESMAVALYLVQGIPYKRILDDQRMLNRSKLG